MGPTMYCWVRVAQQLFPERNFTSYVKKAITEQFTCDPLLIFTFLIGMKIFEGGTFTEGSMEASRLYSLRCDAMQRDRSNLNMNAN